MVLISSIAPKIPNMNFGSSLVISCETKHGCTVEGNVRVRYFFYRTENFPLPEVFLFNLQILQLVQIIEKYPRAIIYILLSVN